MRIVSTTGDIVEISGNNISIQQRNGKITQYRIGDMVVPGEVKDELFGTCSITMRTNTGEKIKIIKRKEQKSELSEFLDVLNASYNHENGIKKRREKQAIENSFFFTQNETPRPQPSIIGCPCCGAQISDQAITCPHCGQPIKGSEEILSNKSQTGFNGVYRQTLLNGLQEVYCPVCGSADCSHYQEQRIIPGKTKTTYSANLNPLKPFTVVNKKEKVVKKERIVTDKKFICNKCGKIFW